MSASAESKSPPLHQDPSKRGTSSELQWSIVLGGATEVRSFMSPPSDVEWKVGDDCYGPQAYSGSLLGTNVESAGFMIDPVEWLNPR
jgi:hypothetical protein